MFSIGVVGYSGAKFDEETAKTLLETALDLMENIYKNHGEFELVSGLTDMGIPAIAYRIADKKGWKLVGIACELADENPCYDVDEVIIEGKDWGSESQTFLNRLDVLIRAGGGPQSMDETEKAKKMKIPVYEFDLPEKGE